MRVTEQWLREWVNPALTTEQLCHRLTVAGLEVDAVEPAAPPFSGVVVGEVVALAPHPDADKLRVCQVDVGGDAPLTIVCGAPNVVVGMKAPTALVGGELPGGITIRKAKLRGVASFGMLCAARELGLADDQGGLMALPPTAPNGTDLRQLLALDDHLIELGLTPNRGDCLSIHGVARELAALTDTPLLDGTESAPQQALRQPVAASCDATLPVTVTASADCPHYVGRVIRGIRAGTPSPLWLQERLRRCGIRSLGAVVDITNYVLLELGQPLHAFDLARLQGGIDVRRATDGERLELLNESEVVLSADDLVIADAQGAVALAGIMGGAASAVDETTCDIFLESALFTPQVMAGRARRHALHTDASHRFERGVDPTLQPVAIERATALLLALVGGEAGPLVVVRSERDLPLPPNITLRPPRVSRLLGCEIAATESAALLERLGMQIVGDANDSHWQVTPPPHRYDMAIEVDLIEEIGRVRGYDQIPSRPPQAALQMAPIAEAQRPLLQLHETLIERGYQEAICYSFVDPKLQQRLDPEQPALALSNPISADLAVMRTTLWAGLLPALVHNVKRQQSRVRLFESGLRFIHDGEGRLQQQPMLAAVACGAALPEQWGEVSRSIDFFDLKGDVEALLGSASDRYRFVAARHPALHPGQSARIETATGDALGWIGTLHPTHQQALGVPPVVLFELQLPALQQGEIPVAAELSRFPAIRRDLALLLPRDIRAEQVLNLIRSHTPSALLQSLRLFDHYQGERIDSDKKSIAVGLTLQAQSRTLTDDEVEHIIAAVIDVLAEQLGVSLRQ